MPAEHSGARWSTVEHSGAIQTKVVVEHGEVPLDHSQALVKTRASKKLVKVLDRCIVSGTKNILT